MRARGGAAPQQTTMAMHCERMEHGTRCRRAAARGERSRHGSRETDEHEQLFRRTAAVAVRDRNCPACQQQPASAGAPCSIGCYREPACVRQCERVTRSASARRQEGVATTFSGRWPNHRCGGVHSLPALSAPLFMAAEFPQRLLKERAPYGLRNDMRFGGKSEADVMELVTRSLRNVSQPRSCRYRTCAVVGSSGNLRGTAFGEAIDAHDAVIRVNAAPLSRHEAAVGTRTTWRGERARPPSMAAYLRWHLHSRELPY